jgi:NADPH-dependent ferric siderophore reductase
MFFRSATVAETRALSGHFREVVLTGEDLKEVVWIPGQKVQFHLGNLMTRAYTPMAWDNWAASARFLFFLHGNGPGSDWASTLTMGEPCQLMGPLDSLDFTAIEGPIDILNECVIEYQTHGLP